MVAASSGSNDSCTQAQLDTIHSMATTGFVETNLGICNVLTDYQVYPFKNPPTGQFQKQICSSLFCQLGIRQFITNPKFPICYKKIKGKKLSVQRHLQTICPDLSLNFEGFQDFTDVRIVHRAV
ncbi:hypothetical protein GN244_ATG09472 [Phytophthora infestans]|uniref:Uncharacterized protein n=1 Tax=Phytophthora infestans TaxID=4787 RepID=A0A833T3C4_PHYIN|nr:hypothetical protein GN244_ATG09472 [Phytophthora infestans]KAF4143374.1 hypothetical protein GN958_ATG07440 [Phytophthora infestans]